MADISKITLPNGSTYDIVDKKSGYTKNTGTITKVQTTAGAHTTINVSSGAVTFNVPTKTSHLTNDSGFTTNTGTITGVTAGSGLSGGGTSGAVTLNHSNSVAAGTIGSSSATSGATVSIPYATYDSNGHITGNGTHTHTITGFSTATEMSNIGGGVPGVVSDGYVIDAFGNTLSDKLNGSYGTSGNTGITMGVWKILWGTRSLTTSSASGSGTFTSPYYADISVSFSFSGLPYVYLQLQGGWTGSRWATPYDISTTGCKIRLYSSHKNSSDTTIRWFAIGKA